MYTLKQFLQEPVIDDARNEKVYSVPEEVDYATACSVEKLVQYFADQRVNINKVVLLNVTYVLSVNYLCSLHLYYD